jgi:hypothetical protein
MLNLLCFDNALVGYGGMDFSDFKPGIKIDKKHFPTP